VAAGEGVGDAGSVTAPDPAPEIDSFVEAPDSSGMRHPDGGELPLGLRYREAGSESKRQAAAGQMIEAGDQAGGDERMAQGRRECRRAKADAIGRHGDGGQDNKRV
jgi:hypothetical protein